MSTEWYTTADVCRLLRVSRNTLVRLRQKGVLHAHKMPETRTLYYSKNEIESVLAAHMVDVHGRYVPKNGTL